MLIILIAELRTTIIFGFVSMLPPEFVAKVTSLIFQMISILF